MAQQQSASSDACCDPVALSQGRSVDLHRILIHFTHEFALRIDPGNLRKLQHFRRVASWMVVHFSMQISGHFRVQINTLIAAWLIPVIDNQHKKRRLEKWG
jgi:hypothetical protein